MSNMQHNEAAKSRQEQQESLEVLTLTFFGYKHESHIVSSA